MLRWKAHVKKKQEELDIRYKKMYWLIGKNASLSLHNKLLFYKQILKPIWTYDIQIWGCTKQRNIDIIQRFQNKVIRNMVNALWNIRNNDHDRDLQVNVVSSEIQRFAQKHEGRNLIFVVPCIMLNSEMIPTRCNNCVYSSQWLYSTCCGWQFHPSSGVQCCIWPFR